MNREETLALFAQGRDTWNAWAAEIRHRRTRLEADNAWNAGLISESWNPATRKWHEDATADFSEHVFDGDVVFQNFEFPGDAVFDSATFNRTAWYQSAVFEGEAEFDNAAFEEGARFDSARFTGNARFESATFEGDTSFEGATFEGEAGFDSATFKREVWFQSAAFEGDASFDSTTFEEYARFNNARFTGYAGFESTTFEGTVGFVSAAFTGTAAFGSATFGGPAWFESTSFEGFAWFESATFTGYVGFENATFTGNAGFNLTKFDMVSSFAGAQFESAANFHAMRGGLSFSLADALFLAVPDFTEANFKEAPRFDNLHIEPGRFAPFYVSRIRSFFKANPAAKARWQARRFRNRRPFSGDGDLPAKWRALKGLAVKGHDHEQELSFFRGELLAQRWLPGKRLRLLFWAGWAYQVFSDFGRSFVRPFLWWSAGVVGFAGLYLGKVPLLASTPNAGFRWLWEGAKSFPSGGVSRLPCVAGDGDPVTAALHLSVQKALPFLGLGSSGRVDQIYACLYGVKPSPLSPRSIPVIPDAVVEIGVGQILYSSVMIFLFLLALRNHFRIK